MGSDGTIDQLTAGKGTTIAVRSHKSGRPVSLQPRWSRTAAMLRELEGSGYA